MVNVCVIMPFFMTSSANRSEVPYAKGRVKIYENLAKRGHEVSIIAPRKHGCRRFEKVKGLPVYRFESFYPCSFNYPIPDFRELTSLIMNIAKERKVEIFHFWQPEFLPAAVLPLIKTKTKKPVLIGINNVPFLAWKYGHWIVDTAITLVFFTLGLVALRNADAVNVLTKESVRWLLATGVPHEKVYHTPTGVDTQTFNPDLREEARRKMIREMKKISDDDIIGLFVGKLVPTKDLDTIFVSLHKLYQEEHRNPFVGKMKILIVGPGDQRRYQTLARKLGIRQNVVFAGYRSDIPDIMAASDVFVFPTLSEGMPNVILEAMASGLPIVATRKGGIVDVTAGCDGNFLVNVGDSDSIACGLRTFIEDEKMRKEVGTKNRQHIVSNFSLDNVVRRYQKLYQLIAKQS